MPHDPDATRIYFLASRAPAAEGIVTVPVDFAHLFSLIPRVGRNATMLYVTLRALRQTAGMGSFKVDALEWLLRARPWRIWWWMHKLSKQKLLVYRLANGYFTDVLLFQVAARPTMAREHDVPRTGSSTSCRSTPARASSSTSMSAVTSGAAMSRASASSG
jgi:hypothetical protein